MTKRKPFDLSGSEIGVGAMLIEASAGTGKTFTISHLVLRLLLERPELTIERILVTTFTELATAELRGRIRALLQDALAAFCAGKSEDEFLSDLLRKHPDHRAASDRLRSAIVNFDEASIYTIHGFCQRVLADRAFESGTLFDAELVTNQSDLLREIVQDFWRTQFYKGERFAALLALKNKITPEKLAEDLEELTRNPNLRILPEGGRSLGEITRDLSATLSELRRDWTRAEKKLRAVFGNPIWAKNNSAKTEKMLPLLDVLGDCLSEEGGTVEQLTCLEAFARRTITRNVRAGHSEPQSPVFEHCERILDLETEFCVALQVEFFVYARAQLVERKMLRNVLSFDDLLTRLDSALAAPGGVELAQSIREKYQAALIDEFQDTDPVQYSIFSRIYEGSDAPLAFIGDPKQAIYAFRGADVFTYMRAASAAARQFTLTTNWRSESGLVEAVNTIFDHPKPFLLDEIQFDRAVPSARADAELLQIDGNNEPPFQLWIGEKDDRNVPERVASEIVRLLASRATIGDNSVEPRHLAVLTSTNAQAAQIQGALRERRVPSVLYSSANIFKTREAAELRDVLVAVTQPTYEKSIRAALATDALGCTGNEIDAFTRDEKSWETEVLRFQKYHQTWRDHGFIQMLRQLANEHGLRQRLLGFPDGERRLTNFLHLTEILHRACVEHRLGMSGLLKWLGQQMSGKSFADREEHELRLESDEKAVRIITVHKSKGLQFDIVFCPFVWHVGPTRKAFHDPSAENQLTLDLRDPKAQEVRREEEAHAEQLRQFYVALTRAKHRCSMLWRPPGRGEDKSAPAYLLGNPAGLPPEIESSEAIAVGPFPDATEAPWEPPQDEDATAPEPRRFKGAIDHSWGIASFTRLVSGREADVLDEGPFVATAEIGEAQGIHAFPRGMQAGTCLHELLEKVNFADLSAAREITARRLRAYGIEGFDEVINENVRQLAALPLAAESQHFALRDVPNEARIAELEFVFPITALTNSKLAEAFALRELPSAIERLRFSPVNGFMNGFIDLTFEQGGRFYFADWKSNWLGANTAAYHPAAIAAEMQQKFYTVQLCLYSVALHRYLRARKPGYDFDRHFGGAFYIFLRGIDPEQPENGVYFERPSRAFVEKLSTIFER